jgi:catechol 2,3-dioxygenase
MEKPSTQPLIHPETRIGHVHLKVANIERSLGFYRDLLGFEITQWYGEDAVFLSAGGYHHHIGLNTWISRNADPAPPHSAGLFHLAILYPERRDLAQALNWLIESNYPIDGASDHGVSEALYLRDPDDNGIELYRDRPRQEWPRTVDGGLAMVTRPLDVDGLLAELKHQE